MRGFVVRLVLLCAGALLATEWARPPTPPLAARSDAIQWKRPSLVIAPDAKFERYEPNAALPLSEQLMQARTQLRYARFWLKQYHQRYGGVFDEVRCSGRVSRATESVVELRLVSIPPVTSEWKVLARMGDTQYLCRVAKRDGRAIDATVEQTTSVSDLSGPDNGLLLYRPVHLRPVPRVRPNAPEQELDALATAIGRLRSALAVYREGRFDPGAQLHAETRVVRTSQEGDRLMVVIGAGSENGVGGGDEWRLSRGSSFVGFVKVIRVLEKTAIAEFDTQFPGNGAPPRAGDRAYSR